MRLLRTTAVILAALFSALLCQSIAAENTPVARGAVFGRSFSISEYVAELDRLSELAKQSKQNPAACDVAIDELRGDWTIEAEGRRFKVNTSWLTDQFEKLKKEDSGGVREQLLARLLTLRKDASAFTQPPSDSAAARATLAQILARKEFHQVHGPTWWDNLKYRIEMWIFRLLERFFGSSNAPVVGHIFVWTLVGIAVLALAWYVYRTIRQNARMESIVPDVSPISAKLWRAWMQEARAAAAQGLWRDAVHLAYWAGISFLEGNGMWRPDQARTPREYLRLLPADSELRSALSTLTKQLEVTWYGTKQAGPETFSDMVTHLEKLGCQQ